MSHCYNYYMYVSINKLPYTYHNTSINNHTCSNIPQVTIE